MKKVLIFLLLIATLCMTACDGGNANTTSNMAPVGDITASTQDVSSEDPHKGWTLVFGTIYIPELPFSNWEGDNQDNISRYTIYIKSKDSAAFHTYAQSLANFGYNIEQTESYSYSGTDPENRRISLTDYENGQMQICIYY